MLAIVLVFAFLATWLFIAQRARFIDEFARLLQHSAVHRTPAGALAGRSYATGSYRGRDVVVRMQLRRSRDVPASFVIAVRAGREQSLTREDIDARTADDEGRRALAALAAQDLLVSLEEGWLKAQWRPQGVVMFPARFTDERWRAVLDDLSVTAASLDAAAG